MSIDRRWPPLNDEDTRRYIAKVIVRCMGNLKKVAWELGLSSRHKLLVKIYKLRLWPVVNAARREKSEMLRRARERKRY